jgi:guanine deaminase
MSLCSTPAATRAMAHRLETVRDLAEELFVLVTLGDERNVVATYVMGQLASACSTN